MATVAGAGGERMLLRRRRLPLGDITNLTSSFSVLTRLKPAARPKPRTSPSAGSSTSSIGSSTALNTRCPPPPPPPPPLSVAAVIKGNDKATMEVQSSRCHLKKIKKISKAKVKTRDVLPGASSPPSKKTRKVYQVTREELLHMDLLDESPVAAVIKGNDKATTEVQSSSCHLKKIKKISKAKVKSRDVLPGASSRPSKKTRKVYQVTSEELPQMDPLDESSDEHLPSQDFIDEQRSYFAEIDEFELAEEFVSSGSDVE